MVARHRLRCAAGTGLEPGVHAMTEEEKESWDWEMYRCATSFDRGYLGNPREQKDFEAAWANRGTITTG